MTIPAFQNWFALLAVVNLGIVPTVAAREIPGFPVRLGEGETTSSPAVGDIDRNGVLDVVMGVGDHLYAIDANGRPLDGFPVKLANLPEDANKRFFSSVALCDLDNNGRLSIVSGGPDKRLYVHGPDGVPRAGFPIEVGEQLAAAPLCADVNADGKRDIVVSVPSKHIAGFQRDGSRLPGFPIKGIIPSESAIAAGDLAPGGPLELIVGGDDGRLYLFDGLGVVDRRRAKTTFRITGGASLGDVDDDGRFDIVFGSQDFSMYAVDFDTFERKPGFPVASGYRIYGAPALGDLDGDDVVDVVFGSADGQVYAVDGKGKPLKGWPVRLEGKVIGSPAIGDLDLDGSLDVVAVSDDGKVYVWDSRGRTLRGTPFTPGGQNKTSPMIVQLDGKRGPEILVVSARGKLHAFSVRTRGKLAAARIPWPTYAHDAERVSRTRPNPGRFDDLTVMPAEPVTTDGLRVDYRYSDLDGTEEGKTRLVWFRNGRRMKNLDDKRTVPASLTKKGESWMARVQGADDAKLFGEGKGAKFWNTPRTRILNTSPSAPTLAKAGAAARAQVRAADGLEVSITKPGADPDGDNVRYRTVWSVDEKNLRTGKSALKIGANSARRGQRVSVLVIPLDNEEEGEPARATWTMANTAPTPPRVFMTPKVPTPASGATLVVKRKGTDIDRDPVVTHIAWSLDGKVLPLLPTATKVPGALLRRGATLSAKVTSFDGFESSTVEQVAAVIGNNAPGRPVATVGPKNPTADTPLTAQVTKRAPDADGDVPTYAIAWTVGGVTVDALAGQWTVPVTRLKKGQQWRATVTANDGVAKGAPAVASIRVGNRAPTPPIVAIEPMNPVSNSPMSIRIVTPEKDPDNDATSLAIKWFADNKPIERRFVTKAGLKPGAAKKGQQVRVEVIARDGTTQSLAVGDAVVLGDRAPVAPKISLAPKAPKTQTPVTMTIARAGTDPDGDAVSYRTHWFVNGARVNIAETVTKLPAKYFVETDTVSAEVWSIADGRTSTDRAKTKVTVVSTAPPAPVVEMRPSKPLPGEPLRVQVLSQSPDVDGHPVKYEVKWLRNGAVAAKASLDGVVAKVTKKGEKWTATVTAIDGADRSPPATAVVVIGNQAPVAPRIELSKSKVTTTENVNLKITRAASDTDGDRVSLDIRWMKNGTNVPELAGKTTVPSAMTKKGERFQAVVIASDGTDKSEPVRAGFGVVDTPPTRPRIAFSPATPVAGANVKVDVVKSSVDVDGDSISYQIKWFLDGRRVKAKKNAFELPGRKLKAGKELRAVVVAIAAKASSSPDDIHADIAPTRPPSPTVAVLPASPLPGETLFAKVTPPVGRTVPAEMKISWLRNGKPANINAPSVPGTRVKRGDKWEVIAIATVAGKDSAPVRARVSVGNRPPVPPQIDLSARSVRTNQAVVVRVTVPATDPDNDAVSLKITWQKNGKQQRSLAGKDTVPASMTKKGDRWVTVFSASDGTAKAPQVTDAFVVENTPPPASSVALSPSSPTAGQAITATITPTAPDADGDRVRHRVQFLVDGVPAKGHDGKSPRLNANAFRRNQRVVVEVTPMDGQASGPTARASVTSVNSAPSLAAVSIRPAKPTAADTLTCAPKASPKDVDSDKLNVIVAWEINGRRTSANGINAALAPEQAGPGAKVRCFAYATDGELQSPEVASSIVEIRSRPPANLQVTLSPTKPATGDSVECGATGEPKDPDGDPIVVAVVAYINGKSQGAAAIPAGKLRAGQTVECRARPADLRVQGAEVKASAKVVNARPTAPVAKISHVWPRAGLDNLGCEVAKRATDPEGDKLRYRIEWVRNGKPAGLPPNARVVPAKALVPSDVWTCRLIASDAGGDGPVSASEDAFVRKPPPGSMSRAAAKTGRPSAKR